MRSLPIAPHGLTVLPLAPVLQIPDSLLQYFISSVPFVSQVPELSVFQAFAQAFLQLWGQPPPSCCPSNTELISSFSVPHCTLHSAGCSTCCLLSLICDRLSLSFTKDYIMPCSIQPRLWNTVNTQSIFVKWTKNKWMLKHMWEAVYILLVWWYIVCHTYIHIYPCVMRLAIGKMMETQLKIKQGKMSLCYTFLGATF